jgi:hypothetical protein
MQPVTTEITFVQGIADVIIKYGFLGLGLVLIIIIPPLIWGKSRRFALVSLSAGLAFLVTFGVLSIVAQFFPWLIISKNPVLFGMVREIPNGFGLHVRDNEWRVGQAYLKRENHPDNASLFNEYFLLVPVLEPKCLGIIIDSTDPNKEQSFSYNIEGLEFGDVASMRELILHSIRNSDGSISLTGWREQDKQRVDPPLKIAERKSGETVCGDDSSNRAESVFWKIFEAAQAAEHSPIPPSVKASPNPSPVDRGKIEAALQSDDPFVRRSARSSLAKLGTDAAPIMGDLLSSGNYRLELGSLAAISEMSEEQRAGLPNQIKKQIEIYTTSCDPAIRETAVRALSGLGMLSTRSTKTASSVNSSVNIAGRWCNNFGTVIEIVQEGDAFRFSALAINNIQYSGQGTISGNNLDFSYNARLPAAAAAVGVGAAVVGRCTGTVFANGSEIRYTCKDTINGSYTASAIKQTIDPR